MSQYAGGEHQFANVNSSIAATAEARKAAALQAKFADADGDGIIDPEEARRAERVLKQHQERLMNIIQLMREKVRQLCGLGGVSDMVKLFKKFDMDMSGKISWSEFEKVMEHLGIPLEPSELRFLMRLLDGDGEGELDYQEFATYLGHGVSLDATQVAAAIFGAANQMGGGKSKGPSEAYKKAWLEKHGHIVKEAKDDAEKKKRIEEERIRQKNIMKYSNSVGVNSAVAQLDTSASLRASQRKQIEKTAFGSEKKILEAQNFRTKMKDETVEKLKSAISAKSGTTDPRDVLEELWKHFDVNNDGTISWKEFCQGMKELGVKYSDAQLGQIIAEFDTNGDGGLDYYEFMDKVAPELGGANSNNPVVADFAVTTTYIKEQAEAERNRPKTAIELLGPPSRGVAYGKLHGGTWDKAIR